MVVIIKGAVQALYLLSLSSLNAYGTRCEDTLSASTPHSIYYGTHVHSLDVAPFLSRPGTGGHPQGPSLT